MSYAALKVKKLYSRCHLGRRCPHLEFARWSSDLPDPSVRREERVPIPDEWLALMAGPMLAQSAVDRIVNSAYELVLEGDSYRTRQKPRRQPE